jgi:hypothetical protein
MTGRRRLETINQRNGRDREHDGTRTNEAPSQLGSNEKFLPTVLVTPLLTARP